MTTVDLSSAQQRLQELTDTAAHGQEVIIIRADGRAFKLIPIAIGLPVFGSAAGFIHMSDDFDEPIDDFEHYYR